MTRTDEDRTAARERWAAWMAKPGVREARNAYKRAKLKERGRAVKELVAQLKGTSCERCGKELPSHKLHCHHRDPATKLFNLGDAIHHTNAAIRAERAKCDVLCDPCHKEVELG